MRETNDWKRFKKEESRSRSDLRIPQGLYPDPLQNPREPSGGTLVGVRSAADHDFSRLSRFRLIRGSALEMPSTPGTSPARAPESPRTATSHQDEGYISAA